MEKIIAQGAEAIVYQKDNLIIKDRIKKSYRLNILDDKIRRQRTKREISLLEKASKIINVPFPEKTSEKTKITMPFIEGKKLSEHLDKFTKVEALKICKQIGETIAKLHDAEIIHGDLTTSNMILDSQKKLYFIDFGLGYHSKKSEDKAVDLHLIKQALEAKHFIHYEEYWKSLEKGYKTSNNSKAVLERLKRVESRGRYKDKY